MALNRFHRTPLGARYRSPLGMFGPPPTTGSPALIIAGQFTVSTIVGTLRAAKWDGEAWTSMTSGLTEAITDLQWLNGTLYASTGSRVVQWNGSSWALVDRAFDFTVKALTVFGGDLIAVGGFKKLSDLTVMERVSRLVSGTWTAMGQGVRTLSGGGTVNDAAVVNGTLYLGGNFGSSVAGYSGNYATHWNGSEFEPVGAFDDIEDSLNNPEPSLVCGFNNELILSGQGLYSVDGLAVNKIVKWTGSAWATLGSGLDDAANDMVLYQSKAFFGGRFSTAGGSAAGQNALWDGANWTTLGSGVSGGTERTKAVLVTTDGTPYLGGNFTGVLRSWDGSAWVNPTAPATVSGLINAMDLTEDPDA